MAEEFTLASASRPVPDMIFRTKAIVRLGRPNRMVTKGYRKGVYDRVTSGTACPPVSTVR